MERLYCTKKTPVYDKSGRLMARRWIDAGDVCLVGDRGTSGLTAVEYPVKNGTYSAFLKDTLSFEKGFKVYNQNDYGYVPYPAAGYVNATVKSGGCGVVAMSMVIENLVLGMLAPEACAAAALSCGARVSGGTDMSVLAREMAKRYPLTFYTSYSISETAKALEKGGAVIVNTGGDRGGYKGIFSSGGHYITLLEYKGSIFTAADPGLYAGKYNVSWRLGVKVENGLLKCRGQDLVSDSSNRYPPFYIFGRKL